MANDELKDCWSQSLFFIIFSQCHPHNVIYQAATTFNDFTLPLQATPDTVEYDLRRLLCKMIVPVGSDLIAHTSSMMENDSFLSFLFCRLFKRSNSYSLDIHCVCLMSLFTLSCWWWKRAQLNYNFVTIIELVGHWQACHFSNKVCGWKCCERL